MVEYLYAEIVTPISPKVLNLAGGVLEITENLHSALTAFRD